MSILLLLWVYGQWKKTTALGESKGGESIIWMFTKQNEWQSDEAMSLWICFWADIKIADRSKQRHDPAGWLTICASHDFPLWICLLPPTRSICFHSHLMVIFCENTGCSSTKLGVRVGTGLRNNRDAAFPHIFLHCSGYNAWIMMRKVRHMKEVGSCEGGCTHINSILLSVSSPSRFLLLNIYYCMYGIYSTTPSKMNEKWMKMKKFGPSSILSLDTVRFGTRQVCKRCHTAHADRLTLLISAFPSAAKSDLLPGLLWGAWVDTCCICVSVCVGRT